MDTLQYKMLRLAGERRKMFLPVLVKGSYFGECERDDEGHCLPSGRGDSDKPEESRTREKPSKRKPAQQPSSGDAIEDSKEWISHYVFGQEGVSGEITEVPNDDVINELSKYVPNKAVVLYRYVEQEKGSGATGQQLRSWTHSQEFAEALLEGHDDKGKVIKKTVYPDEIVVDTTMLPKDYEESITESQQEVIVAYGGLLKKMKEIRGKTEAVPGKPRIEDSESEVELLEEFFVVNPESAKKRVIEGLSAFPLAKRPYDRAKFGITRQQKTTLPIEEIPVDEIYTVQRTVNPANVEYFLAGGKSSGPFEPYVIKTHDGKYYLEDGNTRLSAMVIQGTKKVSVRVLEIDQNGKWIGQDGKSQIKESPLKGRDSLKHPRL